MSDKKYLCIDLKSFYASVECVERGLDPLKTNLVVADASRTRKTICLAVTPSLKAYGISGRARLFEVEQTVKNINSLRRKKTADNRLTGESYDASELKQNPLLAVSYIAAPPRMAYYSQYSANIFKIYLKYVAREDILDYSIDEVFMDITEYLKLYKTTAAEFAKKIINDVLTQTGITATAGIGTNLYIAKIAMDVMAKKMPADENGVRIAELDEMSYRRELWTHRPITDFWRVGKGIAKRLEAAYIFTMGDIARASLTGYGEDRLYKMLGKNAELLIDHAWGYEPCTLNEIRKYRPESKSLGAGQVLHCPYENDKARLIVQEMLELLALELVEKKLVADQIVLTIGYDIDNLTDPKISEYYRGEITTDFYGRRIPKHAHGTANIGEFTSSAILITKATLELFDDIVDKNLLVRRVNVVANHIIPEEDVPVVNQTEQLDFFTDYDKKERDRKLKAEKMKKERKIQEATIDLRHKFGKNAVLRGMNLKEGATTKDRNRQIGGHKA
ncbi:MAG: DNA methylase [Clostridia bacterium]|nr:DNA methylase [Clostridia bacterium]